MRESSLYIVIDYYNFKKREKVFLLLWTSVHTCAIAPVHTHFLIMNDSILVGDNNIILLS